MPLYDYECARCGPFRKWRGMNAFAKPSTCPDCGRTAPRAMATPSLGMDWRQKKAHSINEKSAHEPRVVRRKAGDPMIHDAHRDLTDAGPRSGHARNHAHGHGHRHDHKHGKLERSRHPWAVRH
jgi:putative FmdB family regulatory protein